MHQVLLELFFGRFPAVWCSWITYPRIFIEVTDDRSAASEKTVQLYWLASKKAAEEAAGVYRIITLIVLSRW